MTNGEISDLKTRLHVLYSEVDTIKWLMSPHPQLDGRMAIDCTYDEVKPRTRSGTGT